MVVSSANVGIYRINAKVIIFYSIIHRGYLIIVCDGIRSGPLRDQRHLSHSSMELQELLGSYWLLIHQASAS